MFGDTAITPCLWMEVSGSHVSSSLQPCIVFDNKDNQNMDTDPYTEVRPRRKRQNREGTIFGNNRVGRRGKLICDYCRKRRIRCNYETLESPCEFCRSRNMMACIKRLGPKTEVQLSPTKSMPSSYDPLVPSEDIMYLQYLYLTNTEILCGSIKLDVLARILARVYGPSISYPGLRHIIIALLVSNPGIGTTSTHPTQLEQQHADIAIRELVKKLSNPSEIDESDIFIAYMLAIWSGQTNSMTTEIHAEGVIAIMRHLSRKLGVSFYASAMAVFWAMLRDEIIWLTRESINCYRRCRDFHDILGPKTIHQRQRYENELRAAMIPEYGQFDAKVFFGRSMHTSIHTFMESARIINHCYPLQSSYDPLIESVLVELRVEQNLIEQQGHEPLLELELLPLQKGKYVENWEVELRVVERIFDLLVLNVCRLSVIALEAPSVQQGLNSAKGITASASLVSHLRRSSAFCQAGIQDERVFGTGLGNSYESYRAYKKWPCRQLVEAILRNAPGHPSIMETMDYMQGLTNDFSRFQEIFINRRRTEELISKELDLACFSPPKLIVSPDGCIR